MVNVSGNGTIPAMITPLTELAVRELVGDSGGAGGLSVTTLVNAATGLTATAADITATNDSIKTALGLTSDIVTTTPVTVDNGAGFAAATAAQQAYGKALAAISGMEASLGSTTGAVLNAVAMCVYAGLILGLNLSLPKALRPSWWRVTIVGLAGALYGGFAVFTIWNI